MATAFKIAHDLMLTDYQHGTRLAKMLTDQLQQLEGVHFYGDQLTKLPHIINTFLSYHVLSLNQVGK